VATLSRLGEPPPKTQHWNGKKPNTKPLRRGVLVRQGKTPNARRAIRLPDGLVDELRPLRGIGLVFHTRGGGPLDPPTIRNDHFYPLLKKVELPGIRLHDLRHLHATLLLAQGTDIATVSARLGHSSKAFTLSVYTHALASGQDQAAQSANRLLTQSGPDAVRETR
jgi:integrase